MGATYPTKVILAFRSGGVCAYPSCGKELTYEAVAGSDTYVGEACHIQGEKPKAARYNPDMTDLERDAVENLIYMCANDHTIIDNVVEDWPTEKLIALKVAHEARVRSLMEEGFASIAFPELEKAIAWVSSQAPTITSGDFALIPPEAKIKKNQLCDGARQVIAAGLSGRKTVSQYVQAETQSDTDFPVRLKSGFLAHYYKLRSEGHQGDVLFEMMCGFAQRGCKTQAERTAGVAVLVYLFEICDVFDK